MFSVGQFVGALLVVALVTQLFLWLLRQWDARIPRLLVANGLALFLATVLAAFGKADGGEPNFQRAFADYVIPQIVWLVVGLIREGRAARSSSAKSASEQNKETSLSGEGRSAEEVEPISAPTPLAGTAGEPPLISASTAIPAQQAIRRGRSRNILARHWRGELPLWISYWGFGFLANIVATILVAVMVAALSTDRGYNPAKILAGMVGLWSGLGVILLFQIVGIWRSANRHIDLGRSRIWAGLAKFAVIIGALQVAVEFTKTGYPQIQEVARMTFLDDPDIPAYAIRLMRNGREVEISGGFKYGLDDDFVRILKAAPQVEIVHLNSDGGRLGEAEKLYHTIRERKLATYTSSRCASACTLAFAAGRERWIRDGARLGFHAPTFPGMSPSDAEDVSRTQRSLMIASGLTADFVTRALATPNSTMWYPTHEELNAARAATGIADAYKFAASGWGTNIRPEEIEERFTKAIPLFAALKDVRPDDFRQIVGQLSGGYLAGEPEGRLIDSVRGKLLPIISQHRPLADDQAILELGQLMVDQYKALATVDKQLCYGYASGVEPNRNYVASLPLELRQRETEISQRILVTAKARPAISESETDPLWEAVGTRLAARFSESELELLTEKSLNPAQRALYCDMAIAMYEEILKLRRDRSIVLLRYNFQSMNQ